MGHSLHHSGCGDSLRALTVTSAGEHRLGIACFLALVCSYPVFGNPEAEELCSVSAENTLSPAAEDRTCPGV